MGGSSHEKLQLWGGIECTFNRVADRYHDQLEYCGHHQRVHDLELVAGLGIGVLRYPLIWERAESAAGLDFSWSDERLARLHALRIEPIVGLVHHGSGPPHTSLVSSCFPEKLASYAGKLARRYPWLDRFTPVNEPLTTARFSGLYGHWYPHARDDRTFVRALLTQCRAIALSMAKIRSVNPHAQLVQTEDMGFTRSTESLRYQADFENERRWLSLDLLAGAVSRSHPLYGYLLGAGASQRELAQFEAQPCPADVIGINYYVTSERFLDERVAVYPPGMSGGNRRHRYVDVEAVRVCAEGLVGVRPILTAAYQRYHKPVAITEAHIGCAASQQASWLASVWRAALEARSLGADVSAVTAWALFGSYGWDRLVTEGAGSYEPGALSVASGAPEQTAFASFIRELSSGKVGETEHGWWTQNERLLYEPFVSPSRAA
ncbi:MAG TPA: family 1 glycosylhydrolase [Polyangiaceae bacterium]|nr:family 1 glycosylhydrolase [Polyangiaceae bacterium]